MTEREALKLALEVLEYPGPSWLEARQPAITAIKEVLAQPEQDEKFCDANCVWTDHHPDCKLAQPERTWVGLTDEEIMQLWSNDHDRVSFARAIEAALKEKNT